ncbi:isopeptide-forming domain-containing fimbrial protein, partial [Bacillus sp. JCM 19034]|uniref:isopeptide-forming domain-containing fimbrial protein n=1 Tax=Bacillus sp. JCM 19034 TaxID=1481928 RepID=UPI0012E25253
QFGDVRDTDWHTVTFQVIVGEGQASQDIENIATVNGDNVDEPDEPREEVLIYPRVPQLESEKTAENLEEGKEEFHVGDTVVYTIRARNTVRESLIENVEIQDVVPSGLSYVDGSLEVSHEGTGDYEDGTITATFGDVSDTEWRTVTFQAVIDAGQSETTIENVATVDGDNVEPEEPQHEITVDPKDPKLESEKVAELVEKAEGNTDTENAEVGDTLLYTIQTRNTIEDSLVKNLVIRDELPEGLEYVLGTLEVDGQAVTDDEDDDAGHYIDGEIVVQFGDVRDTDWHRVTFQVTVGEGQASQDIENIATVNGDNIDEPDKPSEEVMIYPREPNVESEKTAKNLEEGKINFHVGDTVVYTIRARNTVRESVVENLVISDELPEGLSYVEGSLEVSHDVSGVFEGGEIIANFGNVTDTEWRTVTFEAVIDAGQSETTIENVATVGGDNSEPEEPQHEITVDPKDPKLESEKAAELVEKAEGNTDTENAEVGDTLLYTIQTRNTIEDSLVKNLVIRDELPEGLEYVLGTLEVDGQAVTDDEDGDAGHYVDGEIVAQFGDVRDTNWHTVTFRVTVGEGQA